MGARPPGKPATGAAPAAATRLRMKITMIIGVCIYIYIQRERERDIDRERERYNNNMNNTINTNDTNNNRRARAPGVAPAARALEGGARALTQISLDFIKNMGSRGSWGVRFCSFAASLNERFWGGCLKSRATIPLLEAPAEPRHALRPRRARGRAVGTTGIIKYMLIISKYE